jgi:hypothetical protein
MRTDLAQYYHSKKPSLRLQYITGADEKLNFEMNGTELLLRDLNIFCTTKTNSRAIMEQLKQLAINNNTTGASIYDLGNVIKSESIAELTGVLKKAEEKTDKARKEEQEHQQKMQQEQIQAQEQQMQQAQQFKADEAEKDRQARLMEAQIRAAGYGAQVDINQNQQSDYIDVMDQLRQDQRSQDEMNLKREIHYVEKQQTDEKLNVEREKLQAQQSIANKQLEIAKENKNKYDRSSSGKKSK